MFPQLNTPLWQACRQARRRQRLVGKISAFLLAVALGVYAVGALVLSLLWKIALGVKREAHHFSD